MKAALTSAQLTAITEALEEVLQDMTGFNTRTKEGMKDLIASESFSDLRDLATGLQVLQTQLPNS